MKVLNSLYGSDTRAIRVFNLLIHVMWAILIIAHISGLADIDLPEKISPSFTLILSIIIINLAVTPFTFINSIYKIKLKYFSLTLGMSIQALIGIKYATNYPPFDVMVIVCTLLAVWFFGGALYIKRSNDMEIRCGKNS